MRRKLLSAVGTAGLIGLVGAGTAAPAQAQDPLDEVDEILNGLVNEAREDAGLDPLEPWDELRDTESAALDWSVHAMSQWHIWHDNAHIDTGTVNAGCEAGAENVAFFIEDPDSLSAQEIAENIFESYRTSPSHWENILHPDHQFQGNGTVTATATGTIDGQEIEVQRWYNTQRFGQNCSADNIPDDLISAPGSEPGGGVMYSEYEFWEEAGITPPDDAVEPVDREGDDPDEPVTPGDVTFDSETLERGYLSPGDEFTVNFGDFEPGDVAYINGIFAMDEGAGYPNVMDVASVSNAEVPESGNLALTIQLFDEDNEVWESLDPEGDFTLQLQWEVRESLHDTDPRPGHEGDLHIDFAGLPDYNIEVAPDELEPGDQYTITGTGFDQGIDVASGLVYVRFGEDFSLLTDEENSEVFVDEISPDGEFVLNQVLLDSDAEVWDLFKDGQVHRSTVEVAVFETLEDAQANNPLFTRQQNVTIRLEDAIEVSPEDPTREDGTNTVTIPDLDGVNYSVDGDVVTGEVEIGEDGITVVAAPVPGYAFGDDVDEDDVTWTFEFDPDAVEDEVVEPEEPQRSDGDENTVTVPEVEGVTYLVNDETVTDEVEVPEDGLTITAEADEGYTFEDDATTEWTFDYIEEDEGPTEVEPVEPEHNSDENIVTVPEVEGVTYLVDDETVTGEVEISEDGLTVTAVTNEGYVFPDEEESVSWTYEWTDPSDDDPDEVVEPQAPQRSDDDENVVIVPQVEGVEYSHGPGEVEVSEDGLTITAEPAEGYTFGDDATTEWSFEHVPADDDDDEEPAEASISVSPSEAAPGETITVEGAGFEAGEEVEISLGETTLGTVEANQDGAFSIEVTVPEDAEDGDYTLTAVGLSSGLEDQAGLTVVDPDRGPAGDEKGPEEDEDDEEPAKDEEELASTGFDSGMALFGLAALLSLALGTVAVGYSRRRV